jgi:hypothetical protein
MRCEIFSPSALTGNPVENVRSSISSLMRTASSEQQVEVVQVLHAHELEKERLRRRFAT